MTTLPEESFAIEGLAWGGSLSPDRQTLVFTNGHGGGGYSVVTRRIDGSPISTLGEGSAPGFSPNGRQQAGLLGVWLAVGMLDPAPGYACAYRRQLSQLYLAQQRHGSAPRSASRPRLLSRPPRSSDSQAAAPGTGMLAGRHGAMISRRWCLSNTSEQFMRILAIVGAALSLLLAFAPAAWAAPQVLPSAGSPDAGHALHAAQRDESPEQTQAPSDLRAPLRAEALRAAVEAALPVVQRSGEEWYESRSCSSCHHAALNLMAVGSAREAVWAVDEDLSARLLKRFRRSSNDDNAEFVQGESSINAQIGQSYRLMALAACEVPANATTDATVQFLIGRQQPDGRWASVSHRPPLEDSEFTATALSARVMQLYAPPGRAAQVAQGVRRAHDWLATAVPRSTEESVMRLFGLAWTGGTPDELAAASAALQSEQRDDGGWAQIPSRASDAFATGEALVALHQVGRLAATDPVSVRGVDYLLRTQLDDGTWLVETRRKAEGLKYFETGFPHGIHQFISCAATCWAISALCTAAAPGPSPIWTRTTSLPRSDTSPAPAAAPQPASAAVAEATPDDDGLPPLIRATLYEDISTMRALLEAGADANERGARGLTPLLCAAGDLARTRLLLDHGADPSARSALDKTALLVAAASSGGLPVLEVLLPLTADDPSRVEDLGEALRLAAISGDVGKVDLLLAAGADVNAQGRGGETALALAGWQGDAAMVRELVKRGADPTAEIEGATPLTNAVIDGQAAVVVVLLEAGVDLEARDRLVGDRTPLHWAAVVDYGSTDTLSALLASGADLTARDEHGDTPLRLAQANGNPHFAALLLAAGATE